jgi:hypothetical protein
VLKGYVAIIPKRLHYVEVGGPLPDVQREFIASWAATNPSFEIVAWNESNIDFTIPNLKQAYDQKRWATVADIVAGTLDADPLSKRQRGGGEAGPATAYHDGPCLAPSVHSPLRRSLLVSQLMIDP